MTYFQVGHKVKIVRSHPNYSRVKVGMVGTIRLLGIAGREHVGMEMDDLEFQGHSCDGTITSHRGYYVPVVLLELVPNSPLEKKLLEYIARELN